MRRETEMAFEYIVQEDRSLLELLDANYVFVNSELAELYGIPDVKGKEIRRVELPAGHARGGVLTQGTMLLVTSNPTRTSPVKRGLFILDNCSARRLRPRRRTCRLWKMPRIDSVIASRRCASCWPCIASRLCVLRVIHAWIRLAWPWRTSMPSEASAKKRKTRLSMPPVN